MRTLWRACLAALVGALVFIAVGIAIRMLRPYDAGYVDASVRRLIWASWAIGSAGAVLAAGRVRGLAPSVSLLAGLAFPLVAVALTWDQYDPAMFKYGGIGVVLVSGGLGAIPQSRRWRAGVHVET
jgi:4-amino-4-deoxy-L-arabinose transferase-like glycosyltransferase